MKMQAGAGDRRLTTIARLLILLDHAERTGHLNAVPYIEQAIRTVATI